MTHTQVLDLVNSLLFHIFLNKVFENILWSLCDEPHFQSVFEYSAAFSVFSCRVWESTCFPQYTNSIFTFSLGKGFENALWPLYVTNRISRRVFSSTVQPSESSAVWCVKALLIFAMIKSCNAIQAVLSPQCEERKQLFDIGRVFVFRFVMVSVFIVLKPGWGQMKPFWISANDAQMRCC